VSERRRRALVALRYAVGLVVLAWLVTQADWARIVATLSGMGAAPLVALVGAALVGTLAQCWTWHLLLNRLRPIPFRAGAGVLLTVRFVNHLTPSQAVGKSLAPAVVRQYTDHEWGTAVGLATLHTGLFAVCYGLVASAGLVAFAPALSPGLLAVVGLSAGLYLLVGPLVLLTGTRLEGAATLVAGLRARTPVDRLPYAGETLDRLVGALPTVGEGAADTVAGLGRDPLVVGGYAAGWATGLLVAPGIRVGVLLWAAGESFTPLVLLPVALVTAYAVTLLPVTPGGIGVAEASATLVLAALGVPAGVAAPVILVDRFLGTYLPAIVGWYPAMRMDLPWAAE